MSLQENEAHLKKAAGRIEGALQLFTFRRKR
jgi:hypothetical protein